MIIETFNRSVDKILLHANPIHNSSQKTLDNNAENYA